MSDKIVRKKTCTKCNQIFTATLEKHPVLGWPVKPSNFKASKKGVCESCSEKREIETDLRRNHKKLFWTQESIKKHFESHIPVVGQKMILLYTGYAIPNEVSYTLVEVETVKIKPRRTLIINTAPPHGGLTFYFSGKNLHAPTGQSLLLPYHKGIGEYISKNGKPVYKDKDEPIEASISLDTIAEILGNQDSPIAD